MKIIENSVTQIPKWLDEDDTPAPNNFYVYCFKNKINEKCYIGKTNNITKRRNKHRRLAFIEKSSLPFYNALRKYGENNFEFTILDSYYSEDIIFDLEKFYIKNYRSNQSEFGYNLTEGGEGSSGLKHNENQIRVNKLKVGEKNGNSKLTEELARTIFNEYRSGTYIIAKLASKHNLSSITIERLLAGKSWKHLKLDISSLKDVKRSNIINSNGRNLS